MLILNLYFHALTATICLNQAAWERVGYNYIKKFVDSLLKFEGFQLESFSFVRQTLFRLLRKFYFAKRRTFILSISFSVIFNHIIMLNTE